MQIYAEEVHPSKLLQATDLHMLRHLLLIWLAILSETKREKAGTHAEKDITFIKAITENFRWVNAKNLVDN